MNDTDKIKLLEAISAGATPGTPQRLSFNTLGKELQLTKAELDLMLTALNKQRYIGQYAKKGVDGFTVVINQQGLDAVEDQQFI